jgi:hypothetical protein
MSAADVPDRPPADPPPLLLEHDFGEERLIIQGDDEGRVSGQAFADARYGDLIVDAVLSLEQGSDHDGYGLFVRQATADRYAAFIASPTGAASIMLLDDAPLQVAGGEIPESFPFNRGLGARNRFSIVACGPMLVAFVNGVALTAANVDERYAEGFAGALLVPGGAGGPGIERSAAVDWVQIRAPLVT